MEVLTIIVIITEPNAPSSSHLSARPSILITVGPDSLRRGIACCYPGSTNTQTKGDMPGCSLKSTRKTSPGFLLWQLELVLVCLGDVDEK